MGMDKSILLMEILIGESIKMEDLMELVDISGKHKVHSIKEISKMD